MISYDLLYDLKETIYKERDHFDYMRNQKDTTEYSRAMYAGEYQAFTEVWCLIAALERKYIEDEEE